MKQKIYNILSFAKAKKPEMNSFLVMYHLGDDNKVIIDSAKPTKGESNIIFFTDFKNPYKPTSDELWNAMFEFVGI